MGGGQDLLRGQPLHQPQPRAQPPSTWSHAFTAGFAQVGEIDYFLLAASHLFSIVFLTNKDLDFGERRLRELRELRAL